MHEEGSTRCSTNSETEGQPVLQQIFDRMPSVKNSDQRLVMTGVGLQIPVALSYEQWENVGRQLSGVVDSSAWWLGDWLVFGKRHYSNRYQQAIRMAGLRYQTLRNYAWVARRFAHSVRRAQLSFQHHAEVASLPVETREWLLDQAQENGWTTKQLRHHIKDDQANGVSATPPPSPIPGVEVPHGRVDLWHQAAEKAGTDFQQWLISTLDHAAEEALQT